MTETKDATITIDEQEYAVADLTEATRAHIANIQFVDAQIQTLKNQIAVYQTARAGYAAALKAELEKVGTA